MRATTFRIAISLAALTIVGANGAALAASAADYAKADRLRAFDERKVGGLIFPHWLSDGRRFYFRSFGLNEQPGTVFLVDPQAGTKAPLFDAVAIAKTLSREGGTRVDAMALPDWTLVDGDTRLAVRIREREYRCALTDSTCAPATAAEIAAERAHDVPDWAVRSPDGRWDAFVWNHNAYVVAVRDEQAGALPPLRPLSSTDGNSSFGDVADAAFLPTGQREGCDLGAPVGPNLPANPQFAPPPAGSIALTTDGETLWSYGPRFKMGTEVATLDADRYRPTKGEFAWSPDSRRLLVRRSDIRGVRVYPLYSSTSTTPVDHSYYYAVPGDKAIPQATYYLLDVASRRSVKVDVPPTGLILMPNAAQWSPDSRALLIQTADRGPKEIDFWKVDPASGVAHALIKERSETFAEMSNGGEDNVVAVTPDGQDIFWFSERDGWGHLYRYGPDGTLKNQVEKGDYSVDKIVRIDSQAQWIYFTAWGKTAGNPYYRHLYRIHFDGTGLTALTDAPGDHDIHAAPDGSYFIDTLSAIDKPPVTSILHLDGTPMMTVSRGDETPLRGLGWRPAETFTVKARDGKTDLWGVMYRPVDFDPKKTYPIVTNVYPGPFMGSVGKVWQFQGADNFERHAEDMTGMATHGEGMGQSLANLGFIVIKLNALGSAQRSKAMQDFFYGRAADNGLPDQIAAIRQLATRYPWIDASRAGIFGHSGGGYAAAAGLLHYPDFFKVGVSEAGNHDFRIYGWYWGEQYQGPLETAADNARYEAQANYKYADQLKGKLLLVHGDMDCNNPPSETLRLVDALEKQGKDFDFLMATDAGHQMPSYVMKRAWDYFVSNLAGQPVPTNFKPGPREF